MLSFKAINFVEKYAEIIKVLSVLQEFVLNSLLDYDYWEVALVILPFLATKMLQMLAGKW